MTGEKDVYPGGPLHCPCGDFPWGPWTERKSVDADTLPGTQSTAEGVNLGTLLNISEPYSPLCKKGCLFQNRPFNGLFQPVNFSP